MDALQAQKDAVRRQMLALRRQIENKAERSARIFRSVTADDAFQTAKTIALYRSLPDEADTAALLRYALQCGKTVALPRVDGERLRLYRLPDADAPMQKSAFGVEEPPEKPALEIDVTQVDLVIVPGVCFDLQRNRLGFGKGYYDRLLQNADAMTIGICFDRQVLPEGSILPVSPTDVPMRRIVTETRTF